jgi:hypothetical protein
MADGDGLTSGSDQSGSFSDGGVAPEDEVRFSTSVSSTHFVLSTVKLAMPPVDKMAPQADDGKPLACRSENPIRLPCR